MDVLKGAILTGALLCSPFANSESNGIFRNGYEEPGYCPPNRAVYTVVSWKYNGSGRRNIDVTLADNIWGRWDAGQTPVSVPWFNVFALLWALPRNDYVAAQFTIPDNLPANQWASFHHAETSGGPPMDAAISTECGDFNPPEPFCSSHDVGTGGSLIKWKLAGYPGPALCLLQPGTTYYFNLRNHDPAAQHFDCTPSACRFNIQNNHTP